MTDKSDTRELANTVLMATASSGVPASTARGGREPGDRLDRYIILDRLGEGGMGMVYAAYDPKLDRKVALKVLQSGLVGRSRAEGRERMVAEARALARVNHVNVVGVHDVGVSGEEVFVGMELVDGRSLDTWLKEQERTWPEVLAVFVDVGRGLCAVHDAGLIHRDVKPANILIGRDGRVRVTDFGLARPLHDAPTLEGSELAVVEGSVAQPRMDITATGAYLGTPAYMSPEQFSGIEVTAKSDQFGFAAACWDSLYGGPPFSGDTFQTLRNQVLGGELREPTNINAVPRWIYDILLRALSREPHKRWPSMAEMVEALAAGDPRARRRRWIFAGTAAAVVASLAVGVVAHQRAQTQEVVDACHASTTFLVWGDAQKKRVMDQFLVSGAAHPGQTATKVIAALDDYAADWRLARAEACLDFEVHHTLEPRLGQRSLECLDTRAAQFEAVVDLLQDPDALLVTRALRMVQGLGDLQRCRDLQHLSQLPPRPEDPQIREQINDLSKALARLQAEEYAGNYEEGLKTAREVLRDAEALAHRELVADTHYQVGAFLEKLGRYEAAVEHFVTAYREAAVAGNEESAGNAARILAHTEGFQLARYDTGLRWAQVAEVHHRRGHRLESMDEAQRLDVLAVMYEMKGDFDRAITIHEQSLALRRTIDPRDKSVSFGLHNFAGVLHTAGQHERARKLQKEAVAGFERHFGRDNPTTGHALFALGNLENKLGNPHEADRLFGEVLTVFRASLGEKHPDIADVLNSQATTHLLLGDTEKAIELSKRAVDIHIETLPKQHPDIGRSYFFLAEAQHAAGYDDDAKAALKAAITILRTHPDKTYWLAKAQCLLGEIHILKQDPEAALQEFEQTFVALGEPDGEPSSWRTRATIGQAWAQLQVSENHSGSTGALSTLERLAEDPTLAKTERARAAIALASVLQTEDRERAREWSKSAEQLLAQVEHSVEGGRLRERADELAEVLAGSGSS